MVRSIVFIAALVWASCASAEIYRWVDQDGRVQFSDRWIQGSERLTDKKKAAEQPKAESLPPEPDSPDEPFLGPYDSLEIVAPAANAILTQDNAGVPISLMVDPPLIEGHQMSVLLDEAALPVQNMATQFKLTGAALGSHRLQIRVKGAGGRVVAQSAPRSFHIEKPKEPGQLR
ncbi:DUF4124 domain-containing protein [Thiocystis violacea]|uniref:DUF4124 domain-containing protein n=1 Tax=Thiocystis violacea TaxID=13725 RepID=UPI001902C229|nr:DUF4124 domain-containing protein [Thiocystis violacea]MBK1722084.1 hypothetical protein [Thiocystis violacea]